jgi:hypothetical protein
MRIFFLLLVLANVAFFGWTYFLAPASGDAQLMQQQLKPEAIRLLTPEEVAQAAAKQAAAQAAAKQLALAAAKRTPETIKVSACVELGAFNLGDVPSVEQALATFSFGPRLAQRRVEETASYWVFIPSQRTRQGANRKVAQLKKLGVEEFFVVQDDPEYRFAISLGVFKSEDAAKARLQQLRTQGVRTARIGSRQTQVQKIFFTVRDVPEPVLGKLNDLRQGFPGTELKDCLPEEKRPTPAPA